MRALLLLLIIYSNVSYAEKQDLAQKLVDLTVHQNSTAQYAESLIKQLKFSYGGDIPDKTFESDEFKTLLSKGLDVIYLRTIKNEQSILMQEHYSEAELKQLIAIFSSPIGKKYIKNQEIMQTELEGVFLEKHAKRVVDETQNLMRAIGIREKSKQNNTYDKNCEYYFENQNYYMFNRCMSK